MFFDANALRNIIIQIWTYHKYLEQNKFRNFFLKYFSILTETKDTNASLLYYFQKNEKNSIWAFLTLRVYEEQFAWKHYRSKIEINSGKFICDFWTEDETPCFRFAISVTNIKPKFQNLNESTLQS